MRRAGQSFAAVLVLGLCLAASSYAASPSTETYAQLLMQINSGQVVSALVNRGGHDVKVTLRDSTIGRVLYPSHDERQLVALLKAHRAHVTYTRRRKPAVHHVLRYVAGGIVIVILAVGGGMFAYTRRRQAAGGPTA